MAKNPITATPPDLRRNPVPVVPEPVAGPEIIGARQALRELTPSAVHCADGARRGHDIGQRIAQIDLHLVDAINGLRMLETGADAAGLERIREIVKRLS